MSLETNLPKIDQKISMQGQQSAVVAYLGLLALSDPASVDLFTDATTLIAQVLPTHVTLMWELERDGEHLSLKAISGWREGTAVYAQMTVQSGSLEEYVLKSAHPVFVSQLETEIRFKPSQFLLDYGAVSGIGMRIGTLEHPSGLIEIFSQQPKAFSQNDGYFLQSIANVLASFMDSKRKDAEWASATEELQKQLVKTQSMLRSGHEERERHEIKSRLVESRERERLQLAQELHDIPIQDLYGLMYQLDDLKDILRDTEGEAILEDFNRTLQRVVDSLRTICGELRPPSLSPFGLEVAIRDHVEKIRSQNPDINIHLDVMRDQQVLSDSLRLCLYRIYQQAINNVMRHAQASEVYIRFRWDEKAIILEVEDNGNGFEMPQHWVDLVRREHFGLAGLAERIESVQGKLKIITAPGDGTLVRVIVPRR